MRFPSDAVVYVATEPVNMQLSFDRLAAVVRDHLGEEPRSPVLVLFHNRRRTLVKALWHDGTGYCQFYKRLDRGTYRIPLAIPEGTSHVRVSRRELRLLLEGMDRALMRRARRRVKRLRAEW